MGINNNHKIQEYMEVVCSEIKNSKVHQEVKDEVIDHIMEITEDYIEEGYSEIEAVNRAIAHMGDASLIGKELSKVHKQVPEWSVLILTLIFSSFGLIATYFMVASSLLRGNAFLSNRIIGILMGMVFAAGLYYFDYRKMRVYWKHIYCITLFLLVFTIVTGAPINGGSWRSIGRVSINFVDISPFLFTIAFSGLLEKWKWRETTKAVCGLTMIFVPVAIMMLNRSFYAVALYTGAVLIILIANGLKAKHTFLLLFTVAGIFAGYIIKEPYRVQRLFSFVNPEKNPLGDGYQNIQVDKLMHSAGLWGNGFTTSAKILPQFHSEFIFTYIVHTFGWVAGILLVTLVILFLIRLSRITFLIKDTYGKLLASGLVAIFSIQFVWNILMNLGFAPITAISLPFISYGNSQFIINMAAIGLISNIYKQRNTSRANMKKSTAI